MEAITVRPRRPWLAAVLSLLFGPLGQVYCGSMRRGILLWLAILLLIQVPAMSMAATLYLGRIGLLLIVAVSLVLCRLYISIDAFLLARQRRVMAVKRYQRWWFYLVFLVLFYGVRLACAHGVKMFMAEAFVVPTAGMSPTIKPGDKILVDKLWYTPERMKRGDIVVFRSAGPHSPPFVKRVVALPGDDIEIKEEVVFVNGEEWDAKGAHVSGRVRAPEVANIGPIRVHSGTFFVLGDNRRNSFDSRLNGTYPLRDVIGRANIIYWSQERKSVIPGNPDLYEKGPIAWDRIGTYLE